MSSEPKNSTVNIGIVGAGLMGQLAHAANYAAIDGCRIAAIAEHKPERRRLVAERYGILRTYSSHEELLGDTEVDAVVVATARPKIGPIALDCLNAGKHIITEKPMAATVEQAKILVKAARDRGVRYAVGYMKRHDKGVQTAKKIVDELLQTGELGEVTFARSHCFTGEFYCNIDGQIITDEKTSVSSPEWAIAPDWMPIEYKQKYARFLNVYCHNINLLRYLLGHTPEVKFVEFKQSNGQVAVLDFGSYAAVLEAGSLTYRGWDEVTEIYFTHGRLRIEHPPGMLRNVPAKVELYKGKDVLHEVYTPVCGWTWAFRRQAEAFVRDVREGLEPIASGADALEDMRLVEEMWRQQISKG
jgi:predicted dehydrogenase